MIDVDLDGFGDTMANVATMAAEIRDEAQQNLNEGAEAGARVAERNFEQKTTDYGLHDGAGIIERDFATRSMEATVDTSGEVTIRHGWNYLLSVEFGARPHFPPVERLTGRTEPLDNWVRRMGPTPQSERQQEMDPDELVEDVAFQVARKISNVGLKERPFMRPGYKQGAAKVRKEMRTFDTSGLKL